MSKRNPKAGASKPRGRPKKAGALSNLVAVRMETELSQALEVYRQRNNLDDASAAVRHALRRLMREEGIIPAG